MMNATEVRDLSDDELSSRLLELKREQFNLRFQRVSGQLEKTARVREVRRGIARIKTIQSERRLKALGEETGAPAPKQEAAAQDA